MKTDITAGMLVVPIYPVVKNVSEQFHDEDIESQGPFKATFVFDDSDTPGRTLINLEGYRGAFPADSFRIATADECVNRPSAKIDMDLIFQRV